MAERERTRRSGDLRIERSDRNNAQNGRPRRLSSPSVMGDMIAFRDPDNIQFEVYYAEVR
jgi:hypothetical protein